MLTYNQFESFQIAGRAPIQDQILLPVYTETASQAGPEECDAKAAAAKAARQKGLDNGGNC